jgi:anthranilate phosphoribosyltransferase
MFKSLLKEVARGKRGSRDLSYEEALEAADWILTQKATPAQIGAFFIAERIKMETVEELEAFVATCRKYAYRAPIIEGIDCSGPYDGRTKSFYATFAAAFLAAAAGLPVTLHGTPSLPPKRGITLDDMLKLRSVEADSVPRERIVETAKQTGVLYVPSEQWCPPLKAIRSIREELDMRTVLNTAEKLVDFSCSPYLIFGVYHNTVFERMSRLSSNLKFKKALIVQGAEGSEDLHIERPTRTYYVSGGEAQLLVIDPEAYGIDTPVPEVEWTAAEQVATVEAVLQGSGDMAFTNQVLLNAAVRLWVADKADSIEEAIYTCKQLLDLGVPWKLYRDWHSMMRSDTAAVNETDPAAAMTNN